MRIVRSREGVPITAAFTRTVALPEAGPVSAISAREAVRHARDAMATLGLPDPGLTFIRTLRIQADGRSPYWETFFAIRALLASVAAQVDVPAGSVRVTATPLVQSDAVSAAYGRASDRERERMVESWYSAAALVPEPFVDSTVCLPRLLTHGADLITPGGAICLSTVPSDGPNEWELMVGRRRYAMPLREPSDHM